VLTRKYLLFIWTLVCLQQLSYAQTLPNGFVYIHDIDPSIVVELRYFGKENFIGTPIEGYQKSVGIVTKQTARALKKVQKKLLKKNLSLIIYDAYRPQQAVDHFARWAKELNNTLQKKAYYPNVGKAELFEKGYIAYRSGHSRGSTVDLSIIDKSTPENSVIDMGSPYDYFGEESGVNYNKLTPRQLDNRKLLQVLMKKHRFLNYQQEWWHFTLKNEPFPDKYFNFPIK